MDKLELYTYFRSSAAYRVRIALNLKGLDWEGHYVHLTRGGGEQHHPEYLAVNPQGLVPALVDAGEVLTQSLAIIEYLEETRPEPRLLPREPLARARVRALAQLIACDIHPLDNTRVLNYLRNLGGLDQALRQRWYCHWIAVGFRALERMLQHPATGTYCHGDTPTLADVCLVPQVTNALRFSCPLAPYPAIRRIFDACMALEPFRAAAPDNQPDAEP